MAGPRAADGGPHDLRHRAPAVDRAARRRRSSCSTSGRIVEQGIVRRAGRARRALRPAATGRSSERGRPCRLVVSAPRPRHRRAVPDGRGRLAGDPLPPRLPARSAGTSTTSRTRARRPTIPGRRRDRRVRRTPSRYVARRHARGRPRRPLGLPRHGARTRPTACRGARLDELYRDAAAIVNLCGATAPRAEHRQGARLIYVETDPVYEQLRIAQRRARRRSASSPRHDVLFTYGENLGAPDCPVPLASFTWQTTRPPVVIDCWERRRRARGARSSPPSPRWRTRARTSPSAARPTSGRSTSTSCASSTCRGARRSPSGWR